MGLTIKVRYLQGFVPVMWAVRSPRTLQKAGSTSNSITYPRSKAAFTLVSFVTGSFYGPVCTPLTRTFPKMVSANLRDGNTSVSPSFSHTHTHASSLTDRRLSLGYGLFYRRTRRGNVELWRLLGGDRAIRRWGLQTPDAVNGFWWPSLGHATKRWRRCDRPRSFRICILPLSRIIQL